MFMNEMDIEELKIKSQNKPEHIRKAAQFLSDFCELLNRISDGWHSWSYGRKCSEPLQDLMEIQIHAIDYGLQLSVTPVLCDKAIAKVKTFLKRCEQTKNDSDVQEFLRNH